jgi:hypothetical protein
MNVGGFSALVESHQAAFAGDRDALPLDVTHLAQGHGRHRTDALLRNPTAGIAGCCARAASDDPTVIAPTAPINSRRLISHSSSGRRDRNAQNRAPMEEGQVGLELASSLQARRLCVTEQTMNTAALITRLLVL